MTKYHAKEYFFSRSLGNMRTWDMTANAEFEDHNQETPGTDELSAHRMK